MFPAFLDRVRSEGEPAKVVGYRETIGIWLVLTAVFLSFWVWQGRALADLGLQWGDAKGSIIGVFLALGVLWITWSQVRSLVAGGKESVSQQVGDVHIFMPRTSRELRWFRGVSVNAGITEEIVFRGFLVWYFEPMAGTFWACVLAVLAFSLSHIYQGLANQPALLMASSCFVGLYMLTGSLLIPMVLHVLVDMLQGELMARELGSVGDLASAPASELGT